MNAERHPGAASKNLAIALAWSAVGLPLLWGIAETIGKTLALFR